MKTKVFTSYFLFTKEQRLGLISLLSLIVILQLVFCFADFTSKEQPSKQKQQWLSLQTEVDSLKKVQKDYKPKRYPFNPNFITDFKGYQLGMSVAEIDRLIAFRKQNKYVNSAQDFQKVTGVSDSLLAAISPYFKFPDWVTNKRSYPKKEWIDYSKTTYVKKEKEKSVVIDINSATKEDLMKVYGIGDAFSDRILKQKGILGAFVSMEQMNDIWGLSPEVIEKLQTGFKVGPNPNPKRININTATIKELGQFPYFRYPISKSIVTFRSMNGDIKLEDLTNIKGFPVDRIQIIALYLEF